MKRDVTGVLVCAGALGLLASEPMRVLLEARMWLHMALQLPLLFVAGCVGVRPWRDDLARCLAPWNTAGLTGLVFSSLVAVVWMVPRSLDAAVADMAIDALKFASVTLAGAMAALSWPAAGVVVRGFVVGNAVWMGCVVGLLYQDAEVRLCNAYLVDDQSLAGQSLVAWTLLLGMAWLASATRGHLHVPVPVAKSRSAADLKVHS